MLALLKQSDKMDRVTAGVTSMPTYEYHAIRAEGDEEKSFVGGVVVAKSRHEAKEKLRQHGLKATMLRQAKGIMAVLRWFDADIR
jgi:type II secretory pathway component PulF